MSQQSIFFTSALCCIATAQAQTAPAPTAGEVLRELQKPAPALPSFAPAAKSEAELDTSRVDSAKVLVKAIEIAGNQELATADLMAIVSSLVGTEQTIGQLSAAARRITAYYRSRGFAVARAYLPAQDVTAGILKIAIVEGRISSSRLANTSLLSDARVGPYLYGIKTNDVVRSSQIDRGLLLLQDTPGVAGSRATLQPGASVGTSELLIEVTPAQRLSGSVSLDNYGSRYTGESRVGLNLAIASPTGRGDQLSLSTLNTGPGLAFGRLSYQTPVGSDGLTLGVAAFGTRYKLAKEFASLDATGKANSTSVFATYPFVRSQTYNLRGAASVERKNLNDTVGGTATVTDKRLMLSNLGITGSAQDAWLGGGITSFDATLTSGQLMIDSAAALNTDSTSAQTNGSFNKLGYGVARLQRLSDNTFMQMSLTGQQAGKNLDSSEKFSLGGINGVRAYPSGEASGDEGKKATLELRHNINTTWQGTFFYDYGAVKTNKFPFGTSPAADRSLFGAGVGVNAAFENKLQIRITMAWRINGGLPTSIPASAAKRPTVWVAASIGF